MGFEPIMFAARVTGLKPVAFRQFRHYRIKSFSLIIKNGADEGIRTPTKMLLKHFPLPIGIHPHKIY